MKKKTMNANSLVAEGDRHERIHFAEDERERE